MYIENWAFLGQKAGEIDGVGEAVGEHDKLYFVFSCKTPVTCTFFTNYLIVNKITF